MFYNRETAQSIILGCILLKIEYGFSFYFIIKDTQLVYLEDDYIKI